MNQQSDNQNASALFMQLVLTFHTAAWQQMGKMVNPMSGKAERNLELSKNSIDMLGMIEEKTKGNLSDEESKFLRQILTELRMNYVEESKKPDEKTEGNDAEEKNSEKTKDGDIDSDSE